VGIVFARAWEDDRLDARLLAGAKGDRVLVVGAAGDAALALAATGARVTAVDINPDQLALVALKAAAARSLDDGTLYRWFEVGRDPGAPAAYRELVRRRLAEADRAFWDERIGMLSSGLHEHAGVGGPFARLGRIARFAVPGLARQIETVADPSSQAAWWRRRVRPVLFGPWTHFLARHTRVLAPLAPHPDELARVRAGGWTRGVADRIDGVVAAGLVREHPWWRPVFSGRPADPGFGARWLDDDALAALRDGDGAAPTLVCADLATALRAAEPGLAAISLSNVPDWLDDAAIADLALAAAAALAPGGRVLVRRVVRPASGDRDPFLAAGLVRDPVSDTLPALDRTSLYEAVDLYRRAGSSPR
jgi:S-adenosylmethionine:diacylglycerol 3-amino-3-carboxypropyl transferase